MILWLSILGILATSVSGELGTCYKNVRDACGKVGGDIPHCNSTYSGVGFIKSNLQLYTALHIEQNFQYLLMSTFFNNYEANREGFSKLYRKLADDTWEDAIDLVKYMAKRGFKMDFNLSPIKKVDIGSYRMHELGSLGVALDMQKLIAEEAHHLHKEVTRRGNHEISYHDAETMNFLEKEFVGKHADTIRDLAGHANDLHQLIAANTNSSLAIYLFDEYLQKVVS